MFFWIISCMSERIARRDFGLDLLVLSDSLVFSWGFSMMLVGLESEFYSSLCWVLIPCVVGFWAFVSFVVIIVCYWWLYAFVPSLWYVFAFVPPLSKRFVWSLTLLKFWYCWINKCEKIRTLWAKFFRIRSMLI